MPGRKLTIPAFTSEAQDGDWWDKHRSHVEADLRRAMRSGATVSLGDVLSTSKGRKEQKPVTIRLAGEDIEAARQLAAAKGVGYQTYIKLLLHDALRKEVKPDQRIRNSA